STITTFGLRGRSAAATALPAVTMTRVKRRIRPSFMARVPWLVDRGRPVRHTTRQPAREKRLMSNQNEFVEDAAKAPDVEDKGAGVRISAMKTFRVGHKVYVRIDSNRKVSG